MHQRGPASGGMGRIKFQKIVLRSIRIVLCSYLALAQGVPTEHFPKFDFIFYPQNGPTEHKILK
jgi:hypothetical protein